MDQTLRLTALRSDRIIGLARLALACAMFLAIWVDPTQPTRVPALTYLLLTGYAAFAITVGAVLFRSTLNPILALVAHFVDLGVFTFLVYTTDGPASPFFLLFTFSIVSAAFRWRWQGVLWTSLLVLTLQILSAAVFARYVPNAVLEMDRFLIRAAHVVVTGGMLVFFVYHRERIAAELSLLRPPPIGPWYDMERSDFTLKCAAHLGSIFDTSRVAFVMEEQEEPSAGAYIWVAGEMRVERITPHVFKALVLQSSVSAWIETASKWRALVVPQNGRTASAQLEAFPGELGKSAQILSVAVPSDYARCRLFLVNPKGRWWDVAVMAELLALQIGEGLDRIETAAVQRRAMLAEERLSLARDLHDGILQTLAGTAVQLENIALQAAQDPTSVPARIRTLQDWLVAEQQELRGVIQGLRPIHVEATERASLQGSQFEDLVQGLQKQWDLQVSFTMLSEGPAIQPELTHHLKQIIREAAANAARHGGASTLDVSIDRVDGGLSVDISDNGTGLSLHKVTSGEANDLQTVAPRSLRERVVKLGGEMKVDTSARGLRLNIYLPMSK